MVSIPRIIEELELLLSHNIWTDFLFLASGLVALLLSLWKSLIGGVLIIGQSNFLLLGLLFQSILLLSSSSCGFETPLFMILFHVGGKMVLLHMVLQCSHSLKSFNMLKGSLGYGIDNVLGTFTL